MALVGDCYNITYSDHPTETEVRTWVLPDGTEGSDTVPVQVENIETYKDVYLVITQVENFNYWSQDLSNKNFIVFYRVYSSPELRYQNPDDYLFDGNFIGENIDLNQPLYEQLYVQIKQLRGLETLING